MPKQICTVEFIYQQFQAGKSISPDYYVTEHFSWNEVMVHQTEKPSLEVLKHLQIVTKKLEILRSTILQNRSIKITSGWRSKTYNANMKPAGAKNSYHIDGMALDFVVDGLTPKQVQKLLDPIWNGGLEYPDSWVHIDTRPYIARFDKNGKSYKVGEYFKTH